MAPARHFPPVVAISVAICAALGAQSSTPSFEVASVVRLPVQAESARSGGMDSSGRGGVFSARSQTLHFLIQAAYGLRPDEFSGGPDWVRTARFDIEARAAKEVPRAEILLMLRTLLTQRFGLELRTEQRATDVYVLRIARDDKQLGPDFKRAGTDCKPAIGSAPRPQTSGGLPPYFWATCAPLTSLVDLLRRELSAALNMTVIDETGLAGSWDFALAFDSGSLGRGPTVGQPQFTSGLPALFDAVRQQLGLRLQRERRPIDVRIISAVHEPTPN